MPNSGAKRLSRMFLRISGVAESNIFLQGHYIIYFFYIWLTLYLEQNLCNKPTRKTIYPHFIE
jgi:hypothetical protein